MLKNFTKFVKFNIYSYLCRQIKVVWLQLNEILNVKRQVTTDFALMTEAALGINAELLINMQARYNMSVAKQKKSLLARLGDIRRACAAVL